MSNNPFGNPPPDPSNPYLQRLGPTPTPTISRQSGLATLSLVLSLLSPFISCLCGISVLTSFTAIVCGHIALSRIKRSGGLLTGRGVALAGVIIGYPMLAFSLFFAFFFFQGFFEGFERGRRAAENPGAVEGVEGNAERFRAAERKIIGSSNGTFHGNSDKARELAQKYSEALKVVRDTMFTKGEEHAISLTGGEFLTYCELHPDRCAFIVHVPQYRDYTAEAKDSLAEAAWTAAQMVVKDSLDDSDQLAVGLKGTLLYGAVMIGEVGSDSTPDSHTRENELEAFFPSPDTAAPVAEQTAEFPPEPYVKPTSETATPESPAESIPPDSNSAESKPAAPDNPR